MAQVVGEAGRLDQVGVAAERRSELAADLGAFEEWVSRVRGLASQAWLRVPGVTTWVFPASRLSAAECSTRARSRWNAVRPGRLSGSVSQRSASAAP